MNLEGKIYPEKIFFVSILTLKGSIETKSPNDIVQSSYYSFEFSTTTDIERISKHFRVILEVTIKGNNEDDSPNGISASYTNEFVFMVENLEDLVTFHEEDKKAHIHINLGVTLVSMAYGTMRGIVHTRTQGTVLQGIILPVIDPKKLISPEDKEIYFEKIEA